MSTRRNFLSAALVGLSPKGERRIAGGFVNESHLAGHALRDRSLRASSKVPVIQVPIVIVGAGIAGLSAAWRLDKKGFRDFVLLEMESQPGGNSRSGENEITAYPWAAHYVPVPGPKAVYFRELMEEFGVLKDGVWNERYLCFTPQERLYLHGRWQDGLDPQTAQTSKDRDDDRRFKDLIARHRDTGQFTVPMELGAKPSPLDQVSMKAWLIENGLTSPHLHWHVDYACRDDFGAHSSDTSAWAGIHYFASREADDKGPLTWPEGNGWIAKRLAAKLARYTQTSSPVWRILKAGRKLQVHSTQATYLADTVIFAAPTFLARYILEDAPVVPFEYSPWVTANLTLDRLPRERTSATAWDNVIYDSPSLGYVVATHMSLRTHIDQSVWTWYHALATGRPSDNRRMLLASDWSYWKELILNDLSKAHPDIRDCVSRVDVMRMGHAMVRPVTGSVFADARVRMAYMRGNILFAHSDLSGFSIFEEAQFRGVIAADRALNVF